MVYSANGVFGAEQCREIVASAHPEAPPAMWYDGQNMRGVGADAITEIGERIGVPIKLIYSGPWKRTLRALEIGEIDLVYALYKTQARSKIYDFTQAYFTDPVVIVTNPKHSQRIQSRNDLPDYIGTATIGDSFGDELDNFIHDKLNIQRVPSYAQLLKLLSSNRVSYGIAPLWTIKGHIRRNGYSNEIIIKDQELLAEKMYMAFSKTSPCRHYLPQINQELAKLVREGEIERLIEKNIESWSQQNRGDAGQSLQISSLPQ